MCMSGREIFKKANLAKMTNTKVIKYGKIAENIAYEIVEHTNNSYANEEHTKKLCILSFVIKKDDKYIYNVENCVDGSFDEIIKYIAECKKAKKILKREEK